MRTVAVFPGRSHPFSLGHKGVYDYLLDNPDVNIDDVFVATSAKQNNTDSPFAIDDKKTMITKTGVPPSRVIQVTNPYKIDEIIKRLDLDPAQDRLIYALGQEGIIYGQEQVYAGENPVKVMRESRLDRLRENIESLQQRIQQLRDGMDYIDEKWSKKYKRSINCASPRGFSQRAHCQGRKKK